MKREELLKYKSSMPMNVHMHDCRKVLKSCQTSICSAREYTYMIMRETTATLEKPTEGYLDAPKPFRKTTAGNG